MGGKRKRSAQEVAVAQPPPKKQQRPSKKAAPKPSLVPFDSSPFVNNPTNSELKREVELYDALGSEDITERLNAATAIVSGLLEGAGVEASTLQRHLERRLFRGLASGRNAARLGYSTVLAEIISQLFGTKELAKTKYPGLTFDVVMGFLVAKTKPEGDLSGQEQKDHFFGLLFGLKSFVRAKVLFDDDQKWNTVLEKLVNLENRKPWIREEVGSVIVEAILQMSQGQVETTLEKVNDAGLAITPEGVSIWLTAKARFPDMSGPTKPWGSSGNPLDRLQSLAKALKESAKIEEGAKQPGNWNPQLHFAWNIVLSQFAADIKSHKPNVKSDFENFWRVAVDENLFSDKASNERKSWGFSLFKKVLQQPDPFSSFFPSIFSRNLIRCLVNHLKIEDRRLHLSAVNLLKVVNSSVKTDPSLLAVFLSGLLGGGGIYNFDKVTKTKTVETLLANINETNAKEVMSVLLEGALSVNSSDAKKDAETRRTVLGNYLLNIIRKVDLTNAPECMSWVEGAILPTLAKIAYGKNDAAVPPLSENTRILFRNRLMSAFSELLASLEGFIYPCHLLQNTQADAVEMDASIAEARDDAECTMAKILKKEQKASPRKKPVLQALALLYSLLLFQLYNGEPESVSVLDELKLCYDKLVRHKETKESDMEASEVLVQLLLSFISRPSLLLRKVTQYVFQAFVGEITSGGLKLMTDVLQSSESLRGQQELFDQEAEEDDQMDEDDEDDEVDSDVEVVTMKGLPAGMGRLNPHLDGSDEEADDIEEEGEGEESAAEDDDETKKLEDALAKALGTHRLDQDDEGPESDSDADMTDSEMMALDEKLVEIFQQRKKLPNKKQEQKDAKETMVNFKSRVLDLLEIFVKEQPSRPLAFELLQPLLQLMRTTKTKALAEKAHSIIVSFSKSLKKQAPVIIDVSEGTELMKTIHLEASKDPSHAFCKAASTASLLIASNLYRADKENLEEIVMVYMGSLVAWVKKEMKIHASFQTDFNNWCQSCANS